MNRLESLRQRLTQHLIAEAAILDGAQSYSIAGRTVMKANLNEVSAKIRYLENEIAAEEARLQGRGRNRVMGIIPRDL